MKPETVEAYRVVKIDGCAHCKKGDMWEVIDRDDCATGTTFYEEIDAEELAGLLNHVFNEGFRAREAADEYKALVADAERYRWLRDKAMFGNRRQPCIAVVGDADDLCLFGDDAEAAIDAARAGHE